MMRRVLLGCSCAWLALHAHASLQIRLRIRNDSPEPFEHVWQGWPKHGTDVDLGPLSPGQTSRWHTLPAALPHYRKTRVQLANRQATGVLHGDALIPGSYTFLCTLQGDSLRVRSIKEPALPE